MIWENRAYYLDRPYFADSFFEASTLMRIVSRCRDAEEIASTIRQMGYRYVVVNSLLGGVFARRYEREEIRKLAQFVTLHLEPIQSANNMTLAKIKD